MTLNYGRPAPPEDFIIGALIPLGLPVTAERDQETGMPVIGAQPAGLPCYLVTALPAPECDNFLLQPLVSVHSFAATRDEADIAAWNADDRLVSLTPGDIVTMPNGKTASAWVERTQVPAFAEYRDPFIKRYSARYRPLLRYMPTQS
ncbi:hypothetical protein KXD96_28005 (plasmid) [Mycobacterium sp. SMC-2]|uniref:hypothetical protein n=1 Tax=Mycobacterium sp. SMC-2 TaxID=2857058 RepID=UPI0021B17534|nr:hypothetical protein [Mycobacterium sp. SMC-2]UXA06585.1 hypothetical protein KXD96_27870 [Mycobacterium sp. SMC-2]UXA09675.1 hypothetical protein KXD96_28005 [Mycobacterium sp. SMC-2]